MTTTDAILLSIIPAALVFLAGLWVQRSVPPEKSGERLLLFLLVIEAFFTLAAWAARRFPAPENPLYSQIALMSSPVLVGVIALAVLHLRHWQTLRHWERWAAVGLALAPLTLLAAMRGESTSIILFSLAGALLVLLIWRLRGHPTVLFGLAVFNIAVLMSVTSIIHVLERQNNGSTVPSWVASAVGVFLFITPALAVALVAVLTSTALRPAASPRFVLVCLGLVGLLLAALGCQIFWLSVWDQTNDGLGGLFISSLAQMVAVGAGLVLAATERGARRWAGPIVAVLVLLVAGLAFNRGWDVSYHQITTQRAERIQTALERFHARQDRYPRELAELAPFTLLVVPRPVILAAEDWCYQGGANYFRLGAFYREFFSAPLSLRVYAEAGSPPEAGWECAGRLEAMKARYDPKYLSDPSALVIPTPIPQPASAVSVPREPVQPLVSDELITPGGWSPDGRYYLFGAQGVAQFLETASGAVCPSTAGYEPLEGLRGRYAWRPDGRLLYIDPDETLLLLRPCQAESEDLTARYPAGFQSILASDPAGRRLLLKGASEFWILDVATLAAWPVAGAAPNPYELHWDRAAWSPGGRQVLISRLNGQDEREGSTLYRIDAGSGAVLSAIQLTHASPQSAPHVEWLSETEALLHGQGDLLRYDFSTDPPAVTSVIKDVFSLDLAYPDEISAVAALPGADGAGYWLVMRANHPRNRSVYVYDSQAGQTAVLAPTRSALLFFPGRDWVEMPELSFDHPTEDVYDLYWLGTDIRGPQPLTVAGHLPREYPGLGMEYLPGARRLAFSSQQGVSLMSIETGELERFWDLAGGSGVAPWVRAAPDESGLLVFVDRVGLYWIPLR